MQKTNRGYSAYELTDGLTFEEVVELMGSRPGTVWIGDFREEGQEEMVKKLHYYSVPAVAVMTGRTPEDVLELAVTLPHTIRLSEDGEDDLIGIHPDDFLRYLQ